MNNRAAVIAVDNRFYCGISKSGRMQTAWCLAGAMLFMVHNDMVSEAVADLAKSLQAERPERHIRVVQLSVAEA